MRGYWRKAEDVKAVPVNTLHRPLIQAMVTCMRPQPKKTISDPVELGILLAAYDYITKNYDLDREEKHFLKYNTFFGNEIVANTRRLALMNLFLHNISVSIRIPSFLLQTHCS